METLIAILILAAFSSAEAEAEWLNFKTKAQIAAEARGVQEYEYIGRPDYSCDKNPILSEKFKGKIRGVPVIGTSCCWLRDLCSVTYTINVY